MTRRPARPGHPHRESFAPALRTTSPRSSLAFLVACLAVGFASVHPAAAQDPVPLFGPPDDELETPRSDPPTDPATGERHRDARSLERLRHRCGSALGGREVTLFANGTVRLRQGLRETSTIQLAELGPRETAEVVARLEAIRRRADLPDARLRARSLVGEWTSRCEVRLDLPGAEVLTYGYEAMDVPPLAVAQIVQVADELATLVRPLDPPERLPRGYEPQRGDVLRDREGERYRVVGPTDDGVGLEMESLDRPIRAFFRLDELRQIFVAVLEP